MNKRSQLQQPLQYHMYDNGFRIIHETPANKLPITCIRIFCNLGSIHETDQSYHGAAHFIEHMCFKGTPKLPNTNEISTKYDEVGAYINAHTEKRYTCYIVKCHNDNVQQSIQILADMMNHSLFDKREYTKEKHVVLEETILMNDQPEVILFHMIDRLLYQGSSYEYPIDTMEYHRHPKSLNYESLVEMYKAFYQPSQMIMSIVSQIPFARVLQMIRPTAFVRGKSTLNATAEFPHPNYYLEPHPASIPCTVLRKKGVQATYFGIGFRTCPHTNPDKYGIDIVKQVIGGYMSSRLFKLLRQAQGLTYSSKVYAEYFEHTGKFFIYVSVDHRKIIENVGTSAGAAAKPAVPNGVIPIIIRMLNHLVKTGITQKELETAKGFLQGNMMLSSENIDNQGFHNGIEYLLYDKPEEIVPYTQLYDRFYKVYTKEQIHNIIRRYLNRSNMYVVCLGENAPAETAILRECAKFSG